ncbi:SDR family oxidoreductase [Streptacidiphilus jiangxiensis]|uniref:NADP-dependent 3-hydroxy acid dehydrogenase YdfG n=1 Tax=Streptacidiphilus jiangxiensis TaxID=235985 RepID=A0A1H7UQ62_STRJI|nr:SDR family oxidoreductase [Streptacidiphilus jiangxiensis]SEL98924.1 NADP-dependent 3-hydroxy acid dehydrogenase YdfG [Streptacidiphilus jiangxiensis]
MAQAFNAEEQRPTGRIALVTGAGSGIGRVTARALGRAGWTVVLTGRREDALQETAAEIAHAWVVPADVTDEEALAALFDQLTARYGRLDLLFNNAGSFGTPAPAAELPAERWRSIVDVNLTGAFLVAQHAFALMRDQDPAGGRIINNGSISAQVPRPNSVAYTATKHAMTGLTKSLALEGRAHRIAVGQIDIGNAATEMTERMTQGILQADGRIAVEPVMDAVHVASTVVHIASLPLDVNVPFMTIMATGMPFLGRG